MSGLFLLGFWVMSAVCPVHAEMICRTVKKGSGVKEVTFLNDEQIVAVRKITPQSTETISGTIPDGIYKEYDAKGRLHFEWSHKNGLLHGSSKEYYDGRRKKYEWSYENGERHGPSRYYSGYGTMMRERTYRGGIIEGVTREYYPTGERKTEIEYSDNKKNGLSREYYRNGQLKSEAVYEDNDRVLQTQMFTEEGVQTLIHE